MITGIDTTTLRYLVTCDTCGDEMEYTILKNAQKNSKKCLYCRKPVGKSQFAKWYRQHSVGFKNHKPWKRWYKNNFIAKAIREGRLDALPKRYAAAAKRKQTCRV